MDNDVRKAQEENKLLRDIIENKDKSINECLAQVDMLTADNNLMKHQMEASIPRADHNDAMGMMRDKAQTLENMLNSATISKRAALRRAENAEKRLSDMLHRIIKDENASTELRAAISAIYAAT